MGNPEDQVSRRSILQGIGAAGAIALTAGPLRAADEDADVKLLPTRKLGRNGPMVPMLAMGGDMEAASALGSSTGPGRSGMRYFDTAQKYGQEHEEAIYRRWFAAHPERRKEIFLVSKDYPTKKGPEELLEMIDRRLEALGTDYLDLYFIHQLCPEVYGAESVNWGKSDVFRKVAETLKASGKVKMVGLLLPRRARIHPGGRRRRVPRRVDGAVHPLLRARRGVRPGLDRLP